MRKGLKRQPWTRRHALKLFEKIGVKRPEVAYRTLRRRWLNDAQLPAELKVHLILGGAICEWMEELAQSQLIRCVERRQRLGEDCAIEQTSSSTLSMLATDIGAILALCREGYDVQARSMLRGFIERLDLLICLQIDHNFAKTYLESQSFEDSRNFFYKNVSGGKLAKRAKGLFKEKFPSATFIDEWLFEDWRTNAQLMFAAAAHSNHAVSMIALFPNLGRGKSEAIGFGGHPTNGSNTTVRMLLTACMPLHFLFAEYPYEEVDGYLEEINLDIEQQSVQRSYYGMLLNFPLVDTWLQDLEAAAGRPSATDVVARLSSEEIEETYTH